MFLHPFPAHASSRKKPIPEKSSNTPSLHIPKYFLITSTPNQLQILSPQYTQIKSYSTYLKASDNFHPKFTTLLRLEYNHNINFQGQHTANNGQITNDIYRKG